MALLPSALLFVALLLMALLFVALLFVALLFVALLFVALLFVALLFVALPFVALLFVALCRAPDGTSAPTTRRGQLPWSRLLPWAVRRAGSGPRLRRHRPNHRPPKPPTPLLGVHNRRSPLRRRG
ncbi:hypothetical protein AB0H83_15185 [Dactylosporangium sp. NPDC050688]|uniref:hypothetical protein n=1 Tax=Dactylosporangium sp. NPDC050688 TaxID=3157217 RepID=UPI0033FD0FDC